MTAPDCKDCAYVRYGWLEANPGLFCGVRRVARPRVADQRAKGGDCGPDAKLFAERQGDK